MPFSVSVLPQDCYQGKAFILRGHSLVDGRDSASYVSSSRLSPLFLIGFQTPCIFGYKAILGDLAYDPSFREQMAAARQPLYITFREHYCFSPAIPVPLHDDEDYFKNSFLPLGCRLTEVEVGSLHFLSNICLPIMTN